MNARSSRTSAKRNESEKRPVSICQSPRISRPEEKERYVYPQVRVIGPGGPYLRMPWQRVFKVSVSIQTVNVAFDPDAPEANQKGTVLEAVTKDQLNIGLYRANPLSGE